MKFISKLLLITMIMSAAGFMQSAYAMRQPTKEYSMRGLLAPVTNVGLQVRNDSGKSLWVRSRNRNKKYYLINNQELKPGQSINANFNLNDLITNSDEFGFNLWKINPATIDTSDPSSERWMIPFKLKATGALVNDLSITEALLSPIIAPQQASTMTLGVKQPYLKDFTVVITVQSDSAETKQIENQIRAYKAQLMEKLPLELSIRAE